MGRKRMRLLLVCGSTREGSSNALALQGLHEAGHAGVTTDYYTGLRTIPAFVPGEEPVPLAVRDLLDRLNAASAVEFSTPEYAGGLPGAFKNLLDWTVGGGELYGKPVAWLDVANPGRGTGARPPLVTAATQDDARQQGADSQRRRRIAAPERCHAGRRTTAGRRLTAPARPQHSRAWVAKLAALTTSYRRQ